MELAAPTEDEKLAALRKVILFQSLAPPQLAQLAGRLQTFRCAAGRCVFSQGDAGDGFFLIRRGLLEVAVGGRRIRTLGTGDYVGERALMFGEVRSASVTALESTELFKVSKEAFQEIVQGRIFEYMRLRIELQNTNVEFSDLRILRIIGRGGSAVVKMTQSSSGVRYALKCIEKRSTVDKSQQLSIIQERSILAEVDHPFIVKFVRSFKDHKFVYLLTELVTGGELLNALNALGVLTRHQARFYVSSLVVVLEFLHTRRIAYLDLKAENCLVDQQGYLKLVDFGLAERIKGGRCYAVRGTPVFMAPEVVLGKGYTTSADLWSLGVCLYEFVTGRLPFGGNAADNVQIFQEVLKAPLVFPDWFESSVSKDLIRGLLNRDPALRLGGGFEGFAPLRGHRFFQEREGFSWAELLGRRLVPPYVPDGESYTCGGEEQQRRRTKQRQSSVFDIWSAVDPDALQDERLSVVAESPSRADPSPGWDAEF